MVVVVVVVLLADVSRTQVEDGVGRAQVLRLAVHHDLRRLVVVMVVVVVAGQFASKRDPPLYFDA